MEAKEPDDDVWVEALEPDDDVWVEAKEPGPELEEIAPAPQPPPVVAPAPDNYSRWSWHWLFAISKQTFRSDADEVTGAVYPKSEEPLRKLNPETKVLKSVLKRDESQTENTGGNAIAPNNEGQKGGAKQRRASFADGTIFSERLPS